VVLKDGKPNTSPTAYVGAARVRAIAALPRPIGAPPAPDDEVNVGLQFSLEPKLDWRRLTALRLNKAVDNEDQGLKRAGAADDGPGGGIGGPGGGIGFARGLGRDFTFCNGASLHTSIRLKKGEKQAKTLKQLKGTLTAEVLGPIMPIISVDDLLDAAGKTFKGHDGSSLEVLELVKGEDGEITVKLALDPPADFTPGIAAAGVAVVAPALGGAPGAVQAPLPAAKLPPAPAAPAGGAIALGGLVEIPANAQAREISLVDGHGKAVQTTRHSLNFRGGDKGWTHMHQFTFRLPKDQETIKLIFSGRRPASIELPFTLKDVPLP
jgi:hypothetical protein